VFAQRLIGRKELPFILSLMAKGAEQEAIQALQSGTNAIIVLAILLLRVPVLF
jgi:hypothetical protein